ncbi:FKBP-type peptidyl-prolyl cis-trans isomerase [Kytococcus sedentarius]|uniref:FKBP-type peptidyl-prolyl cis-trans isomerase n=1 Tax=Kytococcus sedentarius TaxID=1276 RepID=UPI0038507030
MKRTPIRLIALVSTAALTLSACGGEESEENSSESTSSSSSSEAGGDESSEGGEQSSQEPSDGASQGAGADGASGSSDDPSSSGDASGEAQDADGKTPDPEAAGTLDDLEISGGDKPSITFGDGPFTVSETQDKVVEEGDGEELTADHTAMVEYALYNGTSGKELQNAFGQNAVPIGLNDEQTIAALRSALEGKKVGSTIAVAIPAKDAFGEQGAPQLGLEAGDTVVYLMKVTEASKPLKEATGTEKEAPEDFPKAEVFTDKPAKITMPDSEAPKELKEATLIEGEGDEVKKGDQITIHYTGVTWKKGAEGEKFDSSHDRGAPTSFPIGVGSLIPGWDETLVGKKVGSRVELIVPPEKGYGEKGMPNAGIEGDDTLVFVVDILDAQSADGGQEGDSGDAPSE